MNLRIRGVSRALVGTLGLAVIVAGVGAGAGCGGSHNNYPDSSVHFDARPGTGGVSGDAGVRPTPVVGTGVTTLASGAAFLVGVGEDSCTNQDPPSGDRWCAFTMPSSFIGGDDLWVINVTKAAAGTPIKCDVSDLNCLLLTSTLYTGDLTVHGFFGDTLIFYADVGQSTAAAYAWRPGAGMNSARRLTTNALLGGCAGHQTTDAVRCLQNPDNTTVTGRTTFDLSAGFVTVGGNTPLPKVTTFIATLSTDPASTAAAPQPARYRANLSSDGAWIAWSARPDPASPETLVAQKIGDASTRVTIAQDVSRWAFSRDGHSLYWLKSYNYDPAAPLGTLQSTPFPVPPAGTAPTVTTIRPNVSFFAPSGDTGLLVLGARTNNAGQLSLITDSTQPTQVKVLDEMVGQPLSLSRDGRDVVYTRLGTDLFANGVDFASECSLTTGAAALPFGTFSDPPSTMFWVKPDGATGKYLGYYTNTANCQSRMFTVGLWVWEPVKDQGLVYGDEVFFDTVGNIDVTLRYASLTGGALPASGTSIQQRANPIFALPLPYVSAVVYTINAGGDTDGIYLRGDLPFPAATPPPPPLQHPDAGVATPPDGGSNTDSGSDASGGG
jgi:hypothetical protein